MVQSGSKQCFELTILNDDIAESSESFQIMLNYDNKSQNYAVTIEDDGADGNITDADGKNYFWIRTCDCSNLLSHNYYCFTNSLLLPLQYL